MQKTKRKRSYYRALKRGESWAVMEFNLIKMYGKLAEQIYQESNPFIKLIGISEGLPAK